MNHADLRLALGAYVLGALEPTERAEVAAHLEDCARCRAELAELAPLPGLLRRLTPEEARTAVEPVPMGPLTRAVAVAARRRRVRRWRLVAAAATLVVVGGIGASVVVQYQGGNSAVQTISATDQSTGIHALAVLRETASGTEIALTMQGVRSGEHCRLVAIARDGRREVSGSWRAAYDGNVVVNVATDLEPDQLAGLQVSTLAGRPLVNIPVPRR